MTRFIEVARITLERLNGRFRALVETWWTSRREFVVFLFVGALNTIVTYGIYLVLLLVASYPVAYTITMILGIFISYVLNALFVFRERFRWSKALQYPLVYLVQYLLGLGLLYLMVEVFHVSKLVAPLAIVLITVPCTFVLSRYVIKGRARGAASS